MKPIEFDETESSLQKNFVLAKYMDIKVSCKKCGEEMILINRNHLKKMENVFQEQVYFALMGIYLCFGLHPRFLISNFLERI
jgi:hypothetical protein